jgi:hypothetical protein
VAQACNPNPSYLGKGDWGESQFKSSLGKKACHHTNSWVWWHAFYHDNVVKDSPGQPRHKVRLYFKNNQHKKGCQNGLRSGELAQQVQGSISYPVLPKVNKKEKENSR